MSRTHSPADSDPPATRRGETLTRRIDSELGGVPMLEIRLDGGPVKRFLLSQTPLVLGRMPDVGLVLEHHTVSRRHAEMIADLYGRWWIRDLGSTNGTTIGGKSVAEHMLAPGNVIGVGDFSLTYIIEPLPDEPAADEAGDESDTQPTMIRRLQTDADATRISAGHLRTLMELSRRLIAVGDPGERRDLLPALCTREDFHAVDALVIRVEGRRNYRPLTRVHHTGDAAVIQTIAPPSMDGSGGNGRSRARPPAEPDRRKPYISRSILGALHDTREPVVATNTASRFDIGPRAVEIVTGAELAEVWALAVPIRMGSEAMDVLYATVPPAYATAEWLKLYELAGEVYRQGEAVWAARRHAQENAAIEHELDTARQIQLGLVPGPYTSPGLDVTVGFEPCRWVGGDYVDVVPLPDGRVLLTVADVCGKGLQAALVGSSLHTIVRAAADANPPISRLVERVNRHLCEWLPESSFVTMVAAVVDPRKGEIECVNAGHPPMFVVSPTGRLTELQAAENPALGIELVAMASQRARLQPGDVLAMYTDGLSELTNPEGEMLGVARLGEALSGICADHTRARIRGQPGGVTAMCEALTARLDAFRKEELPRDDCTFLLAQRH
jgi:phosphoserine phosphatase RsbU/P